MRIALLILTCLFFIKSTLAQYQITEIHGTNGSILNHNKPVKQWDTIKNINSLTSTNPSDYLWVKKGTSKFLVNFKQNPVNHRYVGMFLGTASYPKTVFSYGGTNEINLGKNFKGRIIIEKENKYLFEDAYDINNGHFLLELQFKNGKYEDDILNTSGDTLILSDTDFMPKQKANYDDSIIHYVLKFKRNDFSKYNIPYIPYLNPCFLLNKQLPSMVESFINFFRSDSEFNNHIAAKIDPLHRDNIKYKDIMIEQETRNACRNLIDSLCGMPNDISFNKYFDYYYKKP